MCGRIRQHGHQQNGSSSEWNVIAQAEEGHTQVTLAHRRLDQMGLPAGKVLLAGCLKRGLTMTGKDTMYRVDKWVRRQAALHTTPESIRRRIAYEREQARILMGAGFGHIGRALEAHRELIRILSERLDEKEAIATTGSERFKAESTCLSDF
jgi:hypothetical protein